MMVVLETMISPLLYDRIWCRHCSTCARVQAQEGPFWAKGPIWTNTMGGVRVVRPDRRVSLARLHSFARSNFTFQGDLSEH
jgi:hypothetical protein